MRPLGLGLQNQLWLLPTWDTGMLCPFSFPETIGGNLNLDLFLFSFLWRYKISQNYFEMVLPVKEVPSTWKGKERTYKSPLYPLFPRAQCPFIKITYFINLWFFSEMLHSLYRPKIFVICKEHTTRGHVDYFHVNFIGKLSCLQNNVSKSTI